jgi:hypothetical protein
VLIPQRGGERGAKGLERTYDECYQRIDGRSKGVTGRNARMADGSERIVGVVVVVVVKVIDQVKNVCV